MKIKYFYIISLLLISIGFSSCQWVTIEPVEVQIPDTGVSFATNIEPIFTNTGCTACHASGGAAATLPFTVGDAYNTLTTKGLINTSSPSASTIITFPKSGHGGGLLPADESLIIAWIEDGAQNN